MPEYEPPPDQPGRLTIKKYPNRRYYETSRSRHLTLDEIHSLIRDGYEIQVTDSRTGENITPKVLAQIIIELDPPKLEVFPVPMLHSLLRANKDAVTEFVQKYFNAPLTAFFASQRGFEQYMRQMMGVRTHGPTMADWARMFWGPLAPGGATGASAPNPARPAPTAPGSDLAEAVEPAGSTEPAGATAARSADPHDTAELRRQLQELRSEVRELRAGLSSPRTRTRQRPDKRRH